MSRVTEESMEREEFLFILKRRSETKHYFIYHMFAGMQEKTIQSSKTQPILFFVLSYMDGWWDFLWEKRG